MWEGLSAKLKELSAKLINGVDVVVNLTADSSEKKDFLSEF